MAGFWVILMIVVSLSPGVLAPKIDLIQGTQVCPEYALMLGKYTLD